MNNKIKIIQGDITKLECDAIVNAANSQLIPGGGVDGAIHKAGGKEIEKECRNISKKCGGCKTGKAIITNSGILKTKYVIHTVGPIWKASINDIDSMKGMDELLKNCYKNSLELAIDYNLHTIAFPNISTGIYGFPKDRAVKIAIETVNDFLDQNKELDEVIFICYDKENYDLYRNFEYDKR